MTAGDISAQPEAPAATHLPTLLVSGQPWDVLEQPSSWTAPGMLPASEGAFSGFAGQSALLEQIAAWAPQSEMPFVSTPSGSGLPPRSGDIIGAGSAQPPSDCELAPLPPSLRIPSLEETNKLSTFGESMLPWHYGSSSMDVGGGSISSMPDLTTGAMKAPLLPMKQVPIDAARREPEFISPIDLDGEDLPVPNNSTSGDLSSARRLIYAKEIISKDKKLQELINTDPKKAKRIIADRFCAAKRKAIKDMRILELERQIEILQGQYNTLSAELSLLQGQCAELKTQRNELSMIMLELEHKVLLKDVKANEQLMLINVCLSVSSKFHMLIAYKLKACRH
ncbi:hypothetical protein PVAP13_8KG248615 [Panicum virgatum]|uniref:BZIP domain-containing protein n=1 Tax=Panicum virgatum TaxID=38727 RepID=A0A8T0PMM2_PANVG|nr:hypothetical protein PVAP13_8KG248615 [Panicum virgatum]